jgi:hypothetical protein
MDLLESSWRRNVALEMESSQRAFPSRIVRVRKECMASCESTSSPPRKQPPLSEYQNVLDKEQLRVPSLVFP